jgi:hypothetical protein
MDTSSGVRKYQPRGFMGLGGSPEKGDQGGLVAEMLRARSGDPVNTGSAATDSKKRRRQSFRDKLFVITALLPPSHQK